MARMGVLMAVRDGAPFVGGAVESVLAQDFPDWELVVVDDGSTDETGAVLAGFRDPRIRVIRTEGLGRAGARNRGLALLKTPWIAVLDGDDCMDPARLGRQAAFLEAAPATDVLVTPVFLADREGRIVGRLAPPPDHRAIVETLPRENCLVHPSSVIRRELLQEAGGYREAFPYAQDYDLWLRLAEKGARFAVLPEELTYYRIHRDSASEGKRELQSAYAALARACFRARRAGRPEPLPADEEALPALARRDPTFHLDLGRWKSRRGRWAAGLGHAFLCLVLGGWKWGKAWKFLAPALLPPPIRQKLRKSVKKTNGLPDRVPLPRERRPGEERDEPEKAHREGVPGLPRPDSPAPVVR